MKFIKGGRTEDTEHPKFAHCFYECTHTSVVQLRHRRTFKIIFLSNLLLYSCNQCHFACIVIRFTDFKHESTESTCGFWCPSHSTAQRIVLCANWLYSNGNKKSKSNWTKDKKAILLEEGDKPPKPAAIISHFCTLDESLA